MLTALDELLSSYNSDDVAYRTKFKDVDTSVCEKTTDKYFLFIPTKEEAKKILFDSLNLVN